MRTLALAGSLAGALLLGCAGARAPVPLSAAGQAPWVVPPAAYGTQRLFRLHYQGPEGEGALRLVLRLVSAERYRLVIADRLGRSLFTLDAAPSGGLLLDHRRSLACPLDEGVELEGLPVQPLPFDALPALLLGRLPASPARGRPEPSARGAIEFRDAADRRWTAEIGPRGRVRSWTLWRGREPVLWWRSKGAEAVLSDRERGAQASWREVGSEPLAGPLPPPAVPEGFEAGNCRPGEASGAPPAAPSGSGRRVTDR